MIQPPKNKTLFRLACVGGVIVLPFLYAGYLLCECWDCIKDEWSDDNPFKHYGDIWRAFKKGSPLTKQDKEGK